MTSSAKTLDPAFQGAGQRLGTEIWRIEEFQPVYIPKSAHGKFYLGDSYIVLQTYHGKGGAYMYDIHFWLGREMSQDEAGTAALKIVELDSHPQALVQCENTHTKLGVVREAVDDTAGAAQFVALHELKDAGAVASFGALKIYNLNVLAQDIQDDSDNITHFLMLAREPIITCIDKPYKFFNYKKGEPRQTLEPSAPGLNPAKRWSLVHRTSIVFSLEDGPQVCFSRP